MEPLALMRFWVMMCSGQRCTAVKVVLAMECVADALVCKINAKICKLTIGMPEDDCDITPVISDTSANFIEGLVQDARCKGARFHQVCCFFHHYMLHQTCSSMDSNLQPMVSFLWPFVLLILCF